MIYGTTKMLSSLGTGPIRVISAHRKVLIPEPYTPQSQSRLLSQIEELVAADRRKDVHGLAAARTAQPAGCDSECRGSLADPQPGRVPAAAHAGTDRTTGPPDWPVDGQSGSGADVPPRG